MSSLLILLQWYVLEDESVEEEFDRFESWCRGKSELYRLYCERIVKDEELRRFVDAIDAANRPYVLFAAIHFLLLGDETHELAHYYPSVSDDPTRLEEGPPRANPSEISALKIGRESVNWQRTGRYRQMRSEDAPLCYRASPL